MKIAFIAAVFAATALALPHGSPSVRHLSCDQANRSTTGGPKPRGSMNVAREEGATDVDEISAALYESWKEVGHKRDTDVDEISAALYESRKEVSH